MVGQDRDGCCTKGCGLRNGVFSIGFWCIGACTSLQLEATRPAASAARTSPRTGEPPESESAGPQVTVYESLAAEVSPVSLKGSIIIAFG